MTYLSFLLIAFLLVQIGYLAWIFFALRTLDAPARARTSRLIGCEVKQTPFGYWTVAPQGTPRQALQAFFFQGLFLVLTIFVPFFLGTLGIFLLFSDRSLF